VTSNTSGSSLLRWQLISFASRMGAMFLGIVQSVVIVRILSVAEYGLVSIVTSVGAAFGVYQHLGLASGSTKEISTAENNEKVFKIFLTSTVIRYLISLPLALTLFILAPHLATQTYGHPELVLPLRIFSLVMLVQGVQSIFNAVISGLQRFKRLFLYQVFIALCSLVIYIPLIYFYKVNGYFYALLGFNILSSLVLGYLALKPLSGNFVFPAKEEFKALFKQILSISLGIFLVKIIYTYWNKIGPLILGTSLSPEQVGIFSFALLYSGKLMSVSDSVTDVNLPFLSKKFKENFEEFKQLFSSNFDKVFAFILFAGGSATYWVSEAVYLVIDKQKYAGSYDLVFPIIFAFIFYSIVNIVKSSILIPAGFIKEMILSFILMFFVTILSYFGFYTLLGPLSSMAWGMAFGSFVCATSMVIFLNLRLGYKFLNKSHIVLLLVIYLLCTANLPMFSFIKTICYVVFVLFYMKLLTHFKYLNKGQLGDYLLSLKHKNVKKS